MQSLKRVHHSLLSSKQPAFTWSIHSLLENCDRASEKDLGSEAHSIAYCNYSSSSSSSFKQITGILSAITPFNKQLSRDYSKRGSNRGSTLEPEDPEDDEELVDEELPAAMLNDAVTSATGLDLATQLKGLPEGPDEPIGSQRTVNLGPYSSELQEWMRQFKVKLVDVNRVSKGSPTGRISQFSALTVAGNKNGIIGLGMGKANGIGDAIKKANRQAVKTLFYVPRYNNATILHPIVSKYGKCIVKMYPKSSGRGCAASSMMKDICKLAGLRDVGIKVYGSRNIRNTIKALIRGLESQVPLEEQKELPSVALKPYKRPRGTPSVQTVGLLNI